MLWRVVYLRLVLGELSRKTTAETDSVELTCLSSARGGRLTKLLVSYIRAIGHFICVKR